MAESQFTKRKIKFFVVILILVAILAVVAGVGIHFYIGHYFEASDISDSLTDRLNLGSSFTVDDILESEQYSYGWMKSSINVEVLVKNPDFNEQDEDGKEGKYIVTKDILDYKAETRTFKVVGIAQGIIVFSNPVDASISLEVPFESKFSSNDTERILKDEDNYPSLFDDGYITHEEILIIQTIKIKNYSQIDMADFAMFSNLRKVIIRNTSEGADVLHANNMNLPEMTNIYVSQDSYLNYLATWTNYANRIFIITTEDSKVSVIFDKMGGRFQDDNGLTFENTETEEGSSLNIGEDFIVERQGYTFVGWYIHDGDVSVEVTDSYIFECDAKVSAQWKANTYTVKLYHNNLTGMSTDQLMTYDVEDSFFSDSEAPVYSGCTLLGWAYEEDATEPDFLNGQTVINLTYINEDVISLYAVWVYDEFTIEYYNGDDFFDSIIGYYNQSVVLSARNTPYNPTGDFIGWAYSKDAIRPDYKYGETVDGLFATPVTNGVIRLYAVFEPAFYSIYYNIGDATPQPNAQQNLPRGQAITLSGAVNRVGYKFKGWQDEGGTIYTPFEDYYLQNISQRVFINNYYLPTGIVTTKSSVTLTPVWEANTFYVHFNKGDADSMYSSNNVVTYGKSYSFTGSVSREGYDLAKLTSSVGSVSITGKTLSVDQIHSLYVALRGSVSDNDFDTNCSVNFSPSWNIKSYTLTISESHVSITVTQVDNGGNVANNTSVTYNTRLKVTFSAKSGYNTPKCYVNGTSISSGYEFNMPAGNVSITSSATEDEDPCVATGTLITMANGSTKKIEEVNVGDQVLAWDFKTQAWVETSITLLVYHGDKDNDIINLKFSNGCNVKVVGKHVFFDITLRQYISLDLNNYRDFIGDSFMSYNDESKKFEEVVLLDTYVTKEFTGAYSIVTAFYYNCITDNIVSATPTIPGIYELVCSYLDEDLNFDVEQFEADIDTYGLYEYEVFSECLSYKQYEELCGGYFKLAVAKGFTTFERIYELMIQFSYIY